MISMPYRVYYYNKNFKNPLSAVSTHKTKEAAQKAAKSIRNPNITYKIRKVKNSSPRRKGFTG